MADAENIGRRVRCWFDTPPSAATLWTRAAVSLWMTPPVLLFPLLLPLLEPSTLPAVLARHWQAYALFFGLPFALGAFCWHQARRAARRDRPGG